MPEAWFADCGHQIIQHWLNAMQRTSNAKINKKWHLLLWSSQSNEEKDKKRNHLQGDAITETGVMKWHVQGAPNSGLRVWRELVGRHQRRQEARWGRGRKQALQSSRRGGGIQGDRERVWLFLRSLAPATVSHRGSEVGRGSCFKTNESQCQAGEKAVSIGKSWK